MAMPAGPSQARMVLSNSAGYASRTVLATRSTSCLRDRSKSPTRDLAAQMKTLMAGPLGPRGLSQLPPRAATARAWRSEATATPLRDAAVGCTRCLAAPCGPKACRTKPVAPNDTHRQTDRQTDTDTQQQQQQQHRSQAHRARRQERKEQLASLRCQRGPQHLEVIRVVGETVVALVPSPTPALSESTAPPLRTPDATAPRCGNKWRHLRQCWPGRVRGEAAPVENGRKLVCERNDAQAAQDLQRFEELALDNANRLRHPALQAGDDLTTPAGKQYQHRQQHGQHR